MVNFFIQFTSLRMLKAVNTDFASSICYDGKKGYVYCESNFEDIVDVLLYMLTL